MKLSEYTLENLKEIVTGDSRLTPYMKGQELVDLFNQYGERDIYSKVLGGGTSRKEYALKKLKKINDTRHMKHMIEYLVDKKRFGWSGLKVELVVDEINKLINHDGYRLEFTDNSYIIIGCDKYEEVVEVIVHFEDIQKQIIDCIRSAKFIIWVAVAWFTDKTLMDELIKKKGEGVNIQVIINDDFINNNGIKFEEYFETYRIQESGFFKNIMHNKFCVIDLKTVIHGSYNWTNKARYNNETISVDISRELSEKFATQFIELKDLAN